MQTDQTQSDWWSSFYDDAMQVVLQDQSRETIVREAELMMRLAAMKPGESVLDQCCGLGQHAIELARRGMFVTGLDQASNYIAAARREAESNHLDVRFMTGDASTTVVEDKVDAVVNWHSSFGYCADDESNQMMLRAAHQSLKPGGRMLLEYPNMVHLLANFKEVMETTLADGTELRRQSRIEMKDETLHQVWRYRFPGRNNSEETREHRSLMRIYLPSQLNDLFRLAGFEKIQFYCGEGNDLSSESARLIVLAKASPSINPR